MKIKTGYSMLEQQTIFCSIDNKGVIESVRIPDREHDNAIADLAKTIRVHSLNADEQMVTESEDQEAVDAFNKLVEMAKMNDELIYETR